MTREYLIYELASGRFIRRLSCPAGRDRKANTRAGEGIMLAGDLEGVPADRRVDVATGAIVSISIDRRF